MKGPQMKYFPQCGIVTARKGKRAKVFIPLLDVETDYIRIGGPYVGAGWGLHAPLHEGNEVLAVFPNGDLNDGVIVCALWSEDCDPPPDEGDHFSLVHESGSVLRFGQDGSLTIQAKKIAIKRG